MAWEWIGSRAAGSSYSRSGWAAIRLVFQLMLEKREREVHVVQQWLFHSESSSCYIVYILGPLLRSYNCLVVASATVSLHSHYHHHFYYLPTSLQPPPHSHCWAPSETLYHRDDALLYIAYVMLIWAAPIPADRWHCSLWP